MRRPVKPFVTEYKGPSRRPGHPAGAAQRLQSDEFSYLTAANGVFSRPVTEATHNNPEDTYEAAMRAADALFSFAGKGSDVLGASASRRESDDTPQREHPGIDADAPEAAHGGGGRILRVIDEPPVSGLAELEADRAPKRRGRKPGSKNKPKTPSSVADAPSAPTYAQPALSKPPLVYREEDFDTARFGSAPAAPSEETAATPYRSREKERFPWVRTKLKPGEEWKRRLPKVCW